MDEKKVYLDGLWTLAEIENFVAMEFPGVSRDKIEVGCNYNKAMWVAVRL